AAGVQARIARVADTVAVRVPLVGVRDVGTVVAGVSDAVPVAVRLVGIVGERAVVAAHRAERRIAAPTVSIDVGAGRIVRAGIAGIAEAVVIDVGLIGVRNRW